MVGLDVVKPFAVVVILAVVKGSCRVFVRRSRFVGLNAGNEAALSGRVFHYSQPPLRIMYSVGTLHMPTLLGEVTLFFAKVFVVPWVVDVVGEFVARVVPAAVLCVGKAQ